MFGDRFKSPGIEKERYGNITMNRVKTITIVAWIITALALTGLVIFFITGTVFGFGAGRLGGNGFNFGVNIGFENLSGPFEVRGEYSVTDASIDTIDIEWVAGEIRVHPHDGSDIRIIESAQRELRDNEVLRYTVRGNRLLIEFIESNHRFSVPRKNLEVLVPQELSVNLNSLEIDTVSGGVIVSELSVASVNLESVSASINASGEFSRVNLDNVSGAITLNNSAENSHVGVENVSGAINLSGSFADVEVSTVSGATTIASTVIPASLNISGVSGNVEIRVPLSDVIAVNHSSVSGRLNSEIPMMTQGGDAQFRISTVSGNTHILALG